MKSRFFLIIPFIIFAISCDHFVNLGDKSYDNADNTEGLPDELYEDNGNTGSEAGDYEDWNEDNADSAYYDEGSEDTNNDSEVSEINDNDSQGDFADSDMADPGNDEVDSAAPFPENDSDELPDEVPDENENSYIFPESDPFPEGFSNVECGCSDAPQYQPVCCDGKISVFNACFANCYAVKSDGKICSVRKTGLCDGDEDTDSDYDNDPEEDDDDTEESDEDNDIIDDNDTELPDSDEDVINNECGCYPGEEPAVFSCGEDSYFITSCLANCLCAEPEKLF